MPAIHKTALSPFQKRTKMSLSQTYYLAHTARGKLSKEAARGDHDLRLLVGHANLLDGLMLDLADAEREQESWFNQTVRDAQAKHARNAPPSAKRVSWADRMPAVAEAESDDESDADSDAESEADEMEIVTATPLAVNTAAAAATAMIVDEAADEDLEDDDEAADEDLALTRSPSRTSSPPELVMHAHDESESESESEDEHMPPSPPTLAFAAPAAKDAAAEQDAAEELYDEGFFLPRQPRAIAAY